MADVKKYGKGETLWYLGRTRCTVVHNTLKPGGVNADEATLFLKTASGSSVAIPVVEQEQFVSEHQISFFKKWPLTPTASR